MKAKNFFFYIFIWVIISCKKEIIPNTSDNIDSLTVWVKESKNKNNPLIKRENLLQKSYSFLLERASYKKRLKTLSDIAYQTLILKDTATFLIRNDKVIKLALKENDSFALGDAYWNYATLFVRSTKYEEAFQNFYKAQSYFKNHPYFQAKMLIGKAFIRGRFLDNIGKEKDLINAIRIFEKLDKYDDLASSYNSLGINTGELNNHLKAIDYFKKALAYDKKGKNKSFEHIYMNLGNLYRDIGDYKKSLKTYEKLFKKIDKENKPKEYARLKSNRTYALFLNNKQVDFEEIYLECLKINDSLGNKEGVSTNQIRLAGYYLKNRNYKKALKFASKANKLALELKNSENILKTYKLLSELDTLKSKFYLDKYIQFSDSLVDLERSYRNKFARIELDTDTYIEENEQLIEERTSLIIIGGTVIIILILLYYLNLQKNKTQKLELEREKQELNKELFELSINQKEKIEKQKLIERKRISEELHDGVLGKLFGTRLALGYLNLEEGKTEKYKKLVDDLQLIEKDLRDVSHQLNENIETSKADFKSLINNLIKEKSELGRFKYSIEEEYEFQWEDVSETIKLNFYRILQELLNNCIKHAQAKEVALAIKLQGNFLHLIVKDDGLGFESSKKLSGIGLKNIKSRVKKLKGNIKIETAPNAGAKIHIKIPRKN